MELNFGQPLTECQLRRTGAPMATQVRPVTLRCCITYSQADILFLRGCLAATIEKQLSKPRLLRFLKIPGRRSSARNFGANVMASGGQGLRV